MQKQIFVFGQTIYIHISPETSVLTGRCRRQTINLRNFRGIILAFRMINFERNYERFVRNGHNFKDYRYLKYFKLKMASSLNFSYIYNYVKQTAFSFIPSINPSLMIYQKLLKKLIQLR